MYITNEPDIARLAQSVDIDRIFVDLEVLGKAERQSTIKSFITHHTVEDIQPVRDVLDQAELMVRINPIYSGSKDEIEAVLKHQPDVIMLPMFKTVEEVSTFIEFVDSRAEISLLLETASAVKVLDEILELEGINEIHVGLNDLHLTLNQTFLFEPISTGMVESIAKKVQKKGIRFGFGGIGRIGDGLIPAEMLLVEHYRINSEMVILSRSFREDRDYQALEKDNWLKTEIALFRDKEKELTHWTHVQFKNNYKDLSDRIHHVVEVKNEKNSIHSNT
jgi:hypothetical protein